VGDCHGFLRSPRRWAERAAGLGWTAQDLFAFPAQSHGSAGLAWRINGDRLVELHRDWALVEAPGTGNCRVLNRQLPARRKARSIASRGGGQAKKSMKRYIRRISN
jgi:hypothetical protein